MPERTGVELYFPEEANVRYLLSLVQGGSYVTLETQRCLLEDHIVMLQECEKLTAQNAELRQVLYKLRREAPTYQGMPLESYWIFCVRAKQAADIALALTPPAALEQLTQRIKSECKQQCDLEEKLVKARVLDKYADQVHKYNADREIVRRQVAEECADQLEQEAEKLDVKAASLRKEHRHEAASRLEGTAGVLIAWAVRFRKGLDKPAQEGSDAK